MSEPVEHSDPSKWPSKADIDRAHGERAMTALPELPEPHNCGGDATIAALLREYGRQCYAAGMELAAQIAESVFDRMKLPAAHGAFESAAAIREAAKEPIGG
jgi:hypothetical protein